MKSDADLKQTYEVFIDERGIVVLRFLKYIFEPDLNTRRAELIEMDALSILRGNAQKKYHVLVDLSCLKTTGYVSSKSRKIYARISSHVQIDKFAFVGGGIFIKTAAGFIIRASGKGERTKWFARKKQAIEWLEGR
jgi:hypothetical protein